MCYILTFHEDVVFSDRYEKNLFRNLAVKTLFSLIKEFLAHRKLFTVLEIPVFGLTLKHNESTPHQLYATYYEGSSNNCKGSHTLEPVDINRHS
jgi:lantibiotic modifying enzyme